MGNTDSNFNSIGAELPSAQTWWGRGHITHGRSYRKNNSPIRSQGRQRIQRQINPKVVLKDGFETEFSNTTVLGAWPVAHSDNGPDASNTILMGAWPVPNGDNVNDDSNTILKGAWPVANGDDITDDSAFLSIKSGSLSSDGSCHDRVKFENNLSCSSCQDSGFGESFVVPSLVPSPDLRTKGETGKKDLFKTRIRKFSDWTGSLSRKKRRVQEPDLSSVWSFNPLQNQNQDLHLVQNPDLDRTSQDRRLSIYQNFMKDLETKSTLDRTEESTQDSQDQDSVDQQDEDLPSPLLDQGRDQDQGMVRRAGWVSIKPLISLNKDQKLELVSRRKWKKYWVTLRGSSLLFFKSHSLDSEQDSEQDQSPRMVLQTWDSLVQPVPEHPSRDHVFCLSTGLGQVYLLQACSQPDLEAWGTSIHSVAAATAARRCGSNHGDTLDFLRGQVHFLSLRIDSDQRIKKMAALQLSLITENHNRKTVEGQISQWEQNLERLSVDLFRFKCYVSSLQGLELPNPKGLLSVASRSSKCMLGRLGVFTVSSFHALVCSRDQATLRRHSRAMIGQIKQRQALIGQTRRRRDLKSSVKTVETINWGKEDQTYTAPQVQDEERPEELTLQLSRTSSHLDFGFAVIGRLDAAGQSHIYISQVDPTGLSAKQGLCAGDQVLSVNGASLSHLDLDLIPSVFSHRTLLLSLRRHRSHDPLQPSRSCDLNDTESWSPFLDHPLTTETEQSSDRINSLYQIFPECQVADPDIPKNPYDKEADLKSSSPSHLRSSPSHRSSTPSQITSSPSHLSVCQRLRKVIEELLETEKSYVKDLVQLFELYLTPLQQETFLSKDEMEALFGSLPAMLDFQRVFLQTLEEKIAMCPDLNRLETPEQFKKLLFSLGGSFLYYADHFKLYSGFCANHIKVQKVLQRAKTDAAFKHFLEARNPTNQHSASLESYLIKPVQRVLKYPLLLRELVSLTEEQTLERNHLSEALRAMEKVATHINEMQKIYEEHGCVFERLTAENSAPFGQVTELSMGDFLLHSAVVWMNPFPSLGRMRKEPQLTLFVFKQAVILVYKDPKMKKRMVSRSDLDPFRFRWLIPAAAVQLRHDDITDCEWELVHLRSESEGRPETVFHLSSSGLESKALVLGTLRSLVKDNAPQNSTRKPLCYSHRYGNHQRDEETSQLEAQLQGLHFSDESEQRRRGQEDKGRGLEEWRRSLVELGSLLDRDFSVQSLTSIINEDCFYNSIRRRKPAAATTS